MKRILITGSDGYLGWPVTLRCLRKGYEVIGIDNELRRKMVEEVGGESGIPIADSNARAYYAKTEYDGRFKYHNLDLSSPNLVKIMLQKYNPDTILHLASQPSAPYSHMDGQKAVFTQTNNLSMLTSILWAIKELKLDTHLIVTTTTGIYGQPDFDIPEGWLQPYEMKIPYPNMAGSFYHMSRGFDAGNLWLASKMFDFPITELRTSIIGGSSTSETRRSPIAANRFDFDYYFGVVTNRFVAQALMEKPITIYGKGDQQRPIISLEDACESTVNAISVRDKHELDKYEIFNQTMETISPVDIAQQVKQTFELEYDMEVQIDHIENPRVENEEALMKMENWGFKHYLLEDGFKQSLKYSIAQTCRDTEPFKGKIKTIGKNYK